MNLPKTTDGELQIDAETLKALAGLQGMGLIAADDTRGDGEIGVTLTDKGQAAVFEMESSGFEPDAAQMALEAGLAEFKKSYENLEIELSLCPSPVCGCPAPRIIQVEYGCYAVQCPNCSTRGAKVLEEWNAARHWNMLPRREAENGVSRGASEG